MDFFKRIGRIARAEFNNLTGKFKGEDAEQAAAEKELDEELSAQSEAEPATVSGGQHWPQDVRQAYAALELPLGSDREAVKKAYRSMLRRYHPDKHAGDSSKESAANELTAALRKHYELLDEFLKKREA